MKRFLLSFAIAGTFVLGLGGAALATHTTQVEEHVVAFTVGTATGAVTITDTDQLPHETITETGPTTTVTETITVTETAPALVINCTRDNWKAWGPVYDDGECRVGTTIVRTNALWFCDRPLSSYGTLPIRVVQTWSIAAPVGQNGIELRTGCSGDGTPAIDLIVVQNLVGVGRISDPLKTRMVPGPQNVDVTGFLNASGPDATPGVGDHQDCIQIQSPGDNYFVNVKGCIDGSYADGLSNTQGAGGAFFWSTNNPRAHIRGGEFVSCHVGLYVDPRELGTGVSGSTVVGAKFRSGNLTAPWCQKGRFNSGLPCGGSVSQLAEFTNVTCQRFVNGAWVDRPPTG